MQLNFVQVISCAANFNGEIFMQQISSDHAAKFHAGNFHAANFLFVQLISVQVISCAANLPSVQLISMQVISRAGNCMQVIGSSKSDSGNFHAAKLSLPIFPNVLNLTLFHFDATQCSNF